MNIRTSGPSDAWRVENLSPLKVQKQRAERQKPGGEADLTSATLHWRRRKAREQEKTNRNKVSHPHAQWRLKVILKQVSRKRDDRVNGLNTLWSFLWSGFCPYRNIYRVWVQDRRTYWSGWASPEGSSSCPRRCGWRFPSPPSEPDASSAEKQLPVKNWSWSQDGSQKRFKCYWHLFRVFLILSLKMCVRKIKEVCFRLTPSLWSFTV